MVQLPHPTRPQQIGLLVLLGAVAVAVLLR